jgi:glycosyltransferase involved in cell wall biosynthesis
MPYDRGLSEYDQGQYDQKCYLPYFCGCAALIRRAAIIDRTIFVPEFFAYYEDSELSRWITSSGFKILYAPRSIVFHRHSATSSEGSPIWKYLVQRSQLIFKYAGSVNTLDKELSAVRLRYTEAVNEELMNILIEYDQQLIKRLKVENQVIKRRKAIGIYNSCWNTLGGGESHSLSIAADLKQFGFIELISESDFDIDLLSKYFSIDLSKCRKLIIPNIDTNWTERFFLFVNATYNSDFLSKASHSWYILYFPYHRYADKKMLESYFFLFISPYTEKWAKTYWTNNIRGEIVYPVRMLRSSENSNRLVSTHKKKRIILSVGRFNPNGHPKKQLEIAKVFRSLVTEMSDTNQWKLILAGSVDYTRPECVAYFDLVKDCLTGLDADIFPNLEREQLNQLFSDATIYVHATGLGCDKESEPEKFEHFGITVLEAIQFGCIPVVLETGGPADIVRNLKIGYCFSSEESLRKALNKLIKCDFSVLIDECKIAQERGSNFIEVESCKPLPGVVE